jgi:4'-phosphopantetheinyl transferase
MTAEERAAFAALPEDQRKTAFLRLWTRKEALLKADGRGLMHDPRQVTVGLDDGEMRAIAFDGRSWTLRDLTLAPGLAAAVCSSGPLEAIRQRNVIRRA